MGGGEKMMSSRDLIHNLLTNEGDIDRVGIWEGFWAETLGMWVEQGYPAQMVAEGEETAGPAEPRRVIVSHIFPSFLWEKETARPESPYKHFDLDMHHCRAGYFDTDPIVGYQEILEETDEWIVKRNGAGAAFKYWKHKSGTPEHVDFLMTSREVWERDYRSHLLQTSRERLETGSWKTTTLEVDKRELEWGRAANKWCFYAHVFVWETMRQSAGDICMYESLILDPGWIHDFNRVYTDFFKAHFQLVFEEVGMPDGIWLGEDLAYRNGLFASPETLRKLYFPYLAELTEFFHSYDLPVVLHCCGNITQALPLIVEAGIDAVQPMEIKAGCDPFAFAEQYGDRLAFVGGLDVRFLETNDPGVIEREVTRLVEGMKARGARYVFQSDHSITPRVTYDSYRYAVDVYRKHMTH